MTGRYRGSAHQDCNLNFQLTGKIPVVFHNLRGYDNHFIMQNIGEIIKKHAFRNKRGEEKQHIVYAIPNNMEKYMDFMLGQNLNSFKYTSQSFNILENNLPQEAFRYTAEQFQSGIKFELMKEKGVYPYDYMDSFQKFNEELPATEDFFSILNDEHVTDKEYQHAREVWETFNLKSVGEYREIS